MKPLGSQTFFLSMLLLGVGHTALALELTWDGGGDGTSWNSSNNWGGVAAPLYTDTLRITTSDTITNLKRPNGSLYGNGDTWRGIVHFDEGTINLDHQFQSGSSGVFNIGDEIGSTDAIFNIVNGGNWMFDRHHKGTYAINVRSDGQLNATGTGRFVDGQYLERNWEMNVLGGAVTSEADWTINVESNAHPNRISLSLGGTVDVGAITVGALDIIDFADDNLGCSFTAKYGGSFADIGEVRSALGSTFTASGDGGILSAYDNGGASFTVKVIPRPTVLIVR